LGLFRKYITQYIATHPATNKDMTMMCRHLQPTEKGIPLEIYVFTSDKRWINYEYIMADIFDHVIASVGYFDLELFELPTDRVYTENGD
jgi:miniconductance mechanosensitive channel